jgi:hypothetical protein
MTGFGLACRVAVDWERNRLVKGVNWELGLSSMFDGVGKEGR